MKNFKIAGIAATALAALTLVAGSSTAFAAREAVNNLKTETGLGFKAKDGEHTQGGNTDPDGPGTEGGNPGANNSADIQLLWAPKKFDFGAANETTTTNFPVSNFTPAASLSAANQTGQRYLVVKDIRETRDRWQVSAFPSVLKKGGGTAAANNVLNGKYRINLSTTTYNYDYSTIVQPEQIIKTTTATTTGESFGLIGTAVELPLPSVVSDAWADRTETAVWTSGTAGTADKGAWAARFTAVSFAPSAGQTVAEGSQYTGDITWILYKGV